MQIVFAVEQPKQSHAGEERPLLLSQQRRALLHCLGGGEAIVCDDCADALSQRSHFVYHSMAQTADSHHLSEFQVDLPRQVLLLG